MSVHKINSLEDLQQEKERLKLRSKIAKSEMTNSMDLMSKHLKNFLLFKVAIPAGVIGLASMGIKKMAESSAHQQEPTGNQEDTEENTSSIPWKKLFFRYLPSLLTFIQTVVIAKDQQSENEASSGQNKSSKQNNIPHKTSA
ncbi:MAG: hypothetical protein DHS20C18_12250 [Saprospiraceae bacterium]|nr:MAG: hypothetical protein DHS20C18_12250 [Saprospiraceae bacterium]